MTDLIKANIGSYPRIGEQKDQQRYRRGHGYFERMEISAHAFRDIEQSVMQEVIQEQINAGLDEITDGLISWDDPVSHFCKNATGFARGGLCQYYGSNFYYRRPRIISKPKWKAPVLVEAYQYAKSVSVRPVRVVITGPLTLAACTESTQSLNARVDFFSDLLAQEVAALLKTGARLIQIDEPQLAFDNDQFALVQKSLKKIIPVSDATFVLATYYGNVSNIWEKLQDLPVAGLNLDLVEGGEVLFKRMCATPGTKRIGLGLVNARNTRLENAESLAKWVVQWIDKSGASHVTISPSAGLELLPRAAAYAKLQLLTEIKRLVQSPNETVPAVL